MSSSILEKQHFRHALFFLFHQKRLLADRNPGKHDPSMQTCEQEEFKRVDFNVEDKQRSARPEQYDEQLRELVDEDPIQI